LDAGSAPVDASGNNPKCGTQPQKKHNWRGYKVGYNPVNFLSPNERSDNGSSSEGPTMRELQRSGS